MTAILIAIYVISTLSFLPLFISIMYKLAKSHNKIYHEIRCKLITLFTLFMIFLIVRLLVYIDINFTHWAFDDTSVSSYYSDLPFYASEIIITIVLSYILFSVAKV